MYVASRGDSWALAREPRTHTHTHTSERESGTQGIQIGACLCNWQGSSSFTSWPGTEWTLGTLYSDMQAHVGSCYIATQWATYARGGGEGWVFIGSVVGTRTLNHRPNQFMRAGSVTQTTMAVLATWLCPPKLLLLCDHNAA